MTDTVKVMLCAEELQTLADALQTCAWRVGPISGPGERGTLYRKIMEAMDALPPPPAP